MKKLIIKSLVLFLISTIVFAQEGKKTFTFKKGEVMDVLLLSTNTNSNKLFERYKKTAFPVAFNYGYEPQPSFAIKELILGNHAPSSLIIGKWASKQKREGFLKSIVDEVPDFHKQRRELFQYFGLTYYQIPKDIEFSIDAKKYTIATALWTKKKKNIARFTSKWEKEIKKHGGKIIIKLKNGTSPTGYYYNSDVFYIIEWKNEEVFQVFSEKYPLPSYEFLANVHQFVIK